MLCLEKRAGFQSLSFHLTGLKQAITDWEMCKEKNVFLTVLVSPKMFTLVGPFILCDPVVEGKKTRELKRAEKGELDLLFPTKYLLVTVAQPS